MVALRSSDWSSLAASKLAGRTNRKVVLANFELATDRRLFGSRPRLYSTVLLSDVMLLFREAPQGHWCVSVIWKHTPLAFLKAGAPDFLSFHKL